MGKVFFMQNKRFLVLMVIAVLLGSMIVTTLNYVPNRGALPNEVNPKIDLLPSPSIIKPQEDISKNSISGAGENIKTGFYANVTNTIKITTPVKEEPGYKYFNLPLNTNYQNISQTNLTFSGVTAKNSLQIIEDNPENFIANAYYPLFTNVALMSFKIPSPCKLKQISLFLQEIDEDAQWIIQLYNATRDLSEDLNVVPDPNGYTGVSISQRATNNVTTFAAHWQNFTFPNTQLNMTNTYVDSRGFAYYFLAIALPICYGETSVSLLYYSFDQGYVDDGYAYFFVYGLMSEVEYLPADYCLKLLLAPLSLTPTPSDVCLSILNPSRPAPTSMHIEDNHSAAVAAARNTTTAFYLLAQNFTLSDYGTINNIALYLKCYGDVLACVVGIFPDNNSRPNWDANELLDLNMTLTLKAGTTGWVNFTMNDLPNLPPGTYWWIIEVASRGNVTLFGASDSFGNSAIALNTFATGDPVQLTSNVLPYDFASIIYYQPGREVYNVSKSWISAGHLLPDISGYVTYQIITRWLGNTAFNVTYTVELENNRYFEPNYIVYFNTNMIWWNITLVASFPTPAIGKIINLTLPLNWSVNNVTRNGQDHGSINWSIYQFPAFKILSIYRASETKWTIWCNMTATPLNYIVEKFVGTQFQPASNATVYDSLRFNINITSQNNGLCFLTIFYPDGKSSFKNQTRITTETTLLYWFPENDSAATGGNYTFIVHWTNGTKVGFNLQYFWFTPIPANISVISEFPSPYVNDLTKSLTIRYNDSRGVNIMGATLYTELNGNSLEWDDVYGRTLNIQDKGKYRIKLNTSGLTANQYYSLTGWIAKEGYVNTTISDIQILILPVPTLLIANVPNITEYQNEMISFSCSFKDVFHGTGIDWAIITYEIIDTPINGTLTNIMPGESVYITEDVQLKNLIDRSSPYQINLTALADNCESRSILIDLFVLNKTGTALTLLNVGGLFIQGRSLLIQARLQDDSTGENIPNATIRFTFDGVISDRIARTDENGIAEIEISVPTESFTITAWFDETSSMAQSTALSQSINVITYSDLALWIGILAAVCVSAILAVRQFYVLPKRRRKMKEYTKIATKFMDIANIRHILIIHKETSACIYQQSFGPSLDADLISGFISAISTFQTELKPEKLPQKAVKTGGFELSYQDYKILLFHGDLIGLALIVEEPPSEDFRQKVQSFVREYEAEYKPHLLEFRGNVGPFKTSGQLIADKLELSLLWPHQLYRPAPTVKLSSMDEALIQIADTIMKSQVVNYFFLPLVISMGQAGMAKSKLEVIAAVYTLRQRTILRATNPESIKE